MRPIMVVKVVGGLFAVAARGEGRLVLFATPL